MKKTTIIRIVNLMAVLLHIIRVILVNVAIIGFFGEAEGSLWPTQFIAVSIGILAIVTIIALGKVINWLDRISDRFVRE